MSATIKGIISKGVISAIGASVLVIFLAACGEDTAVAPASTAVAQPQAQPTATRLPTQAPTASLIPTPTSAPTATPLPTPMLAPTDTATPRLVVGIARPTATPVPTPTPAPDLDQLGQNRPPHIFMGTVMVGGLPAPDGTVIKALVDGVEVASVQVEDGKYPALVVL